MHRTPGHLAHPAPGHPAPGRTAPGRSASARRPAAAALAPALLLALLLAGCGSSGGSTSASDGSGTTPTTSAQAPSDETSPTPSKQGGGDGQDPEPAAAPGRYVDWADYDADRAAYADTDVVLFFHAPWCPSCRATEESIDADGVPAGLTLVKVDYDSATDLRQEYGVTVQHTFVAVDADGAELQKWTGTLSGAEIAAEIS